MAASECIPPGPQASEIRDIIQDLIQYLYYQKKNGARRLALSSHSLTTLASWEMMSQSGDNFKSQGPVTARVVLVDGSGRFFSGDAGRLVTKILSAMKLSPDAVSICNAPNQAMIQRHVLKVRPRVAIALGDRAVRMMTGQPVPLENFRGQFFNFHGIAVMPTFHPLQLLTDPALKRPVWEDMQQVMKLMETDS